MKQVQEHFWSTLLPYYLHIYLSFISVANQFVKKLLLRELPMRRKLLFIPDVS